MASSPDLSAYAFVQPIVPSSLPNIGAAFVVGILPVFLVLVLLGVFRVPAWLSALAGLALTILIACVVWTMPVNLAFYSLAIGMIFALWNVCWVVFNALALFNLTVRAGHFDGFRRSLIYYVPNDKRVYLVIIGFCVGALIEGIAGFGSTIAICSSMLVNLGFEPLHALTISLIFDTTPVAFGALGVPITTLAKVTDLPTRALSAMQGRQLPFIGLFLPLYVQFFYSGWRGVADTWALCLVAGASFGVIEFAVSNYIGPQLPDVLGSLGSLIVTILFLQFHKPKNSDKWRAHPPTQGSGIVEIVTSTPSKEGEAAEGVAGDKDKNANEENIVIDGSKVPETEEELVAAFGAKPNLLEVFLAWAPWIMVSAWVIAWIEANVPNNFQQNIVWTHLDKQIYISAYAATPKAAVYGATYAWQPLGTGTGILCAVISTYFMFVATGAKARIIWDAYVDTVRQVYLAVLTVTIVIGLAYVMNYSGIAYSLGLALASLGNPFAFFSPFLGWIACFLSGSDTSSNTLFGNLQKLAAQTIGLNRILICVSNSTGAVMAKMVSVQNVTTGVTTVGLVGKEGSVIRKTLPHSIAFAILVGCIVCIQQWVTPGIIPAENFGS
ncbi:lactate permease [Zopfochytrium polystomum]|nr:lactate permease [Zopfochytrium polystomum]